MTDVLETYGTWDAEAWRRPTFQPVALASPAAGAALVYTVPGAVEVEVLAVSALYTASGNAANRIPKVQFVDASGVVFCEVATPYKLVASDVSQITFGVGIVQFGADSAASIGAGIPGMRLMAGLQVKLTATAINATDQLSAARLFTRQWPITPVASGE